MKPVSTDLHAERVAIGKILKPRGLRGEVKVLPLTDWDDRFERVDRVCVSLAGEDTWLEIEQVRYHDPFVYVSFIGRTSREAIEDLLGKELLVDQADVPVLPEGVFYQFEILDAVVFTDDGQRLGSVIEILNTGAHDVYVVQGEKREYLIPATDEIVRQIDREKKTITIHPIEGLLEL